MDGIEWAETTRRAGELAGQLAQVQADLVALMVELLDTAGWAGDGVRSPEHWLQVYTGLSPAQARGIVRIAQRADDLAGVRTSMEQGRLTLDQASVIAEHVPTWALPAVEPLAERTTVTQLRRAVAKYPYEHEQQHYEEPRQPLSQRPAELSMRYSDGRFQLRFSTNEADGALLEQAIYEAKDALFTAGNESATLSDGLVEVASRSLAAIDSPGRREHYRVMLHLSTDGSGWLERHGALPRHLLKAFTCDGTVRPVWQTDGLPVSVGRSQRIVPQRTRRLVEDRDAGCRYPGCAAASYLENHHIVHWSDGGATDLENLVSLCSAHHRMQHQGYFTIGGDPNTPDGLEFRTHHGRVIEVQRPGPDAPRPDRPPPIRDVTRGERLSLGSVNLDRSAVEVHDPPPWRPLTIKEYLRELDEDARAHPGVHRGTTYH